MAAASKSPDEISELDVAGGINGEAIEVITGPDSGLPIPADCEMAFETIVDLDNMVENTLGEFGAQYGTEHAPMCKVTSMLQRNDAMFYTLMAGQSKRAQQSWLSYCLRYLKRTRAENQTRLPKCDRHCCSF